MTDHQRPCPHCGKNTDSTRVFCEHCKKALIDLKSIKIQGPKGMSRSMDYFYSTGDPAVFAQPGAPDYDPTLPR